MMDNQIKTAEVQTRGTWFQRALIWFFAGLLSLLIYWLFGFVIDDIGNLPRPLYSEFIASRMPKSLTSETHKLSEQTADIERSIKNETTRLRLLRESQRSLLEIQRLKLQKSDDSLSEDEKAVLVESQKQLLENQRKEQELSATLEKLHEQQYDLATQQSELDAKISQATVPIDKAYAVEIERGNFCIAALKLLALTPLLLIAFWIFRKYRNSHYGIIVFAYGLAVLLKALSVMHECFPDRYFKYVLIGASIGAVLAALVILLRSLFKPNPDALLKQYREAYETFFCPICRFPIRRGPLKFSFWNARSIKKMAPVAFNHEDRPYTCPLCSTQLFETCAKCGATRHSLLPACVQCGDLKVTKLDVAMDDSRETPV